MGAGTPVCRDRVAGCSAPTPPQEATSPHSTHRQLGLLELRPRGAQDGAQAEGRPGRVSGRGAPRTGLRPRGAQDGAQAEGRPGRGSAGAGLLGSGGGRPALGLGLGGRRHGRGCR